MQNPLSWLSRSVRPLHRFDGWWSEPDPRTLQALLASARAGQSDVEGRAWLRAISLDVLEDRPESALEHLRSELPARRLRDALVRYRLAYLASRCGRRQESLDLVKDLRSGRAARMLRCIEKLDHPFTMTAMMHETVEKFGVHEQFGCLETAVRRHGYRRGAEVGVFMAFHAQHLLEACRNVSLVCVDLYAPTEGSGYDDWSSERFEQLFQVVQGKLGRFGRATFRRMPSVDAAGTFADGELDFVYLDADHRYQQVKGDIHAWLRTVRPGGTLAGHDYAVGSNWEGVKQAVDEWSAAAGKSVVTGPGEYWGSIV